MRFVPVKTAEQQSRAMVFKTRDLLVRQRNQIAGALRGHLMEHGIVAPAGLTFVKSLVRQIDDPDSGLPPLVVELARLHLDQLQACSERIAVIERRLRDEAREPTPRPSGCRPRPGSARSAPWRSRPSRRPWRASGADGTSRPGSASCPFSGPRAADSDPGAPRRWESRDIRRLPIIGAMTRVRWAVKNGAPEGSWLTRMLARKPRVLVAIALANKTARAIWAMMTRQEGFAVPAVRA